MTALKSTEQASILGTFVPPGVIMPFAGATAPAGWLLCDGSEISETTYASLFAAISTTYNTQVNPTTGAAWAAPSGGNFRVPDYRATFLRGVGTPFQGDASTLGSWQVHKTRKNGLSASTSSGGEHQHPSVGTNSNGNLTIVPGGTGGWASMSCGPGNSGQFSEDWRVRAYSTDSGHGHTITVADGDTETRPHNKGVNYIIKY